MKSDYPEILNLKLVDANLEKEPKLKNNPRRNTRQGSTGQGHYRQSGKILCSKFQRFCCARKVFVDEWPTGHTEGHVISIIKPIASQP